MGLATHTSEEDSTHNAAQYCACWVYLMQHKLLDFTSAYLEEFPLNYIPSTNSMTQQDQCKNGEQS